VVEVTVSLEAFVAGTVLASNIFVMSRAKYRKAMFMMCYVM